MGRARSVNTVPGVLKTPVFTGRRIVFAGPLRAPLCPRSMGPGAKQGGPPLGPTETLRGARSACQRRPPGGPSSSGLGIRVWSLRPIKTLIPHKAAFGKRPMFRPQPARMQHSKGGMESPHKAAFWKRPPLARGVRAPAGPNGRESPRAQHNARKSPPEIQAAPPRDLKGAPGGFGMQGPGATGAPGADRATPKYKRPS